MSPDSRPRIGLIGDDLGTSLSPELHETEAAALGLVGYRYERIDLAGVPDAASRLGETLRRTRSEGFTGFNVTHPYKQAIMPFLDALDPAAAALGAVNTVVQHEGATVGYNTDRSGFLSGLRRTLPEGIGHRRVVLFGAGGAGSAVAAALLDYGVEELSIIDTEPARLEQLRGLLLGALPEGSAVRIRTGGPERSGAWVGGADGVVNATPVGMEHIPGTPFDPCLLESRHWVADVVYRPVVTELLAAATDLGCLVVNGTTMLVEQAADTFALVTGVEPDRDRMREHLARLLSAKSATNA